MSDNEQQPSTPQLTRRQLRELRNTASNPIIVDPDATDDASAVGEAPTPAPAPLPRAAEPVEVPPAPVPQASVDLGSPALTRRQARLQEKIRTASIPVVTATGEHPTVSGDHADTDHADADVPESPDSTGEQANEDVDHVEDGASIEDAAAADIERADADAASDAPEEEVPEEEAPGEETPEEDAADHADEAGESEVAAPEADESEVVEHDAEHDTVAPEAVDGAWEPAAEAEAKTENQDAGVAEAEHGDDEESERHVVSNDLGADLLAGEATATEVPASFDQLLSRSAAATGAFTTPNALILAENPDAGPLVAPVTATGEVLITGTFSLPENFGSTGVVPGVADGKEVDAVLVDGELPASSSPTPIAASAAISTIKSAEDVIRPPAPEKGSRWTVALAITAGALALALAGVLLVSLFTGVFG
ncbi:hypothetical protein [Microbacterium arborescens]|uniref:hypothetical protein n=1 Tax=Microbacterium arborescens TaxID=33883 RepID=UPI0025A2F2F9|nr:hypothetical protein [Microbacterium arborescens]WJM14281.1 hypothetical protein QUC20_08160 [Microbacterium arborescens]